MKKLEDEIKQVNFKSEHHKLMLNILFTNYWLQQRHDKLFEKFDITQQQFNILRILRGQYPKPSTVNLLIERMLNKMCDASRLVEKLRVKGLVERVQCPEDRRACNVLITDKGLDLLGQIDPYVERVNKEFLANITSEEAAFANNVLDKLRQEK